MMRRPRTIVALSLAVVLIAGAALGYRWLTSSRGVTANSAVATYRSQHIALAQPTPTPAAVTHQASASKPAGASKVRAVARGAAPTPNPTAWWHPPASGVYTFKTTGYEKATFSRNYPAQSQRIIDTHSGAFENHHIFSKEHEEWFSLHPSARGGELVKRRMRITFGPVTVDETVVFDPALLGIAVPYQLDRTWSGSWKGDTSGSYTAKMIDHKTIRVGTEDVEVWVSELKLQLQGKVSGTVETKLWFAPKLGTTAREDGVYDIRSQGVPGTYHTEYTITLTSTHPQQ